MASLAAIKRRKASIRAIFALAASVLTLLQRCDHHNASVLHHATTHTPPCCSSTGWSAATTTAAPPQIDTARSARKRERRRRQRLRARRRRFSRTQPRHADQGRSGVGRTSLSHGSHVCGVVGRSAPRERARRERHPRRRGAARDASPAPRRGPARAGRDVEALREGLRRRRGGHALCDGYWRAVCVAGARVRFRPRRRRRASPSRRASRARRSPPGPRSRPSSRTRATCRRPTAS